MSTYHEPARSFELGTLAWGLSETPEDFVAKYEVHHSVNVECMRFAWNSVDTLFYRSAGEAK